MSRSGNAPGPGPGHGVLRWLAAVAGSAVLYLVMVARFDGASVVQGLVVSAAAVTLAGAAARRADRTAAEERFSLLPLLRRLPELAVWEVLKGSWKVAGTAAGLRPRPERTLVEVPLGESPAVNPAALAILETLSPGTFLVDVDRERGVLIYHLFDRADAPGLQRRQAELLGRPEPEGASEGGPGGKEER